jgi:hypothetical protein
MLARCTKPEGCAITSREDTQKIEAVKDSHTRQRRYAWAELLKRIFAVDALKLPRGSQSLINMFTSTDMSRRACDNSYPDRVRRFWLR